MRQFADASRSGGRMPPAVCAGPDSCALGGTGPSNVKPNTSSTNAARRIYPVVASPLVPSFGLAVPRTTPPEAVAAGVAIFPRQSSKRAHREDGFVLLLAGRWCCVSSAVFIFYNQLGKMTRLWFSRSPRLVRGIAFMVDAPNRACASPRWAHVKRVPIISAAVPCQRSAAVTRQHARAKSLAST